MGAGVVAGSGGGEGGEVGGEVPVEFGVGAGELGRGPLADFDGVGHGVVVI